MGLDEIGQAVMHTVNMEFQGFIIWSLLSVLDGVLLLSIANT